MVNFSDGPSYRPSILFLPLLFVLGLRYLVMKYPPALYIGYVIVNVIIDSIFVNYVIHHQGTAKEPTPSLERRPTSLVYKERWTINTWKYEKSAYLFFTLYSFISGIISFALICVYTINFCMELTLKLVDHHFDHSDEINRTSFWLWITNLITVRIYQLYQSDNWIFVAVKEYVTHSLRLSWAIYITLFYLFPLSWMGTFLYIVKTQTEASNTALKGTGLTIMSGYFVIFFTVFISLHSLTLLWYNYGDHENTFFTFSSLIRGIPAKYDFVINPARFWRVSHVIVAVVFEIIEITVVDNVHFSRDYVEKLFKWMAIQGLVWAFVYFTAQCVIVIFMNSRLFFAFSQGSKKISITNIFDIENIKIFINKLLLSLGPFDEAIFLVFGVFSLNKEIFWAMWTFFAFVCVKYMKWYDSAWSLSLCFYWWFTGKRRKCDENFYNYWQERKVLSESFIQDSIIKPDISVPASDLALSEDEMYMKAFSLYKNKQFQDSERITKEIFKTNPKHCASLKLYKDLMKQRLSQSSKHAYNFNKKIIFFFLCFFVVAAASVAWQIMPYFKRGQVQLQLQETQKIINSESNINVSEIAKMSKDEYIEMILNLQRDIKNEQELNVIANKLKSNAQDTFFIPYPVCNIVEVYNKLSVLDLIMFTMIPYLESEAQHKKVLEIWFGDKYEYVHYNSESPAFFHIKYKNKLGEYPFDVIAIRGTKKIHDFTQDLSLFTEVASLQIVSWLFPLTSFLPNPFLRSFIYFTSWNWDKFICWMQDEKYTLFYHQIEKYINSNMAKELSKEKNYKHSIYVVGHSLGGGLAEIVAAKFGHNGFTNVFSFGLSSPGVSLSSNKFEFRSDELDKTSISIIPRRDIVPKIDVHGGLKQQIDCAQTSFLDCHYGISSFCEIVNSCPKLIQDEKKKVFANCICLDNLGVEYNTFCFGGDPQQHEIDEIEISNKKKQEL